MCGILCLLSHNSMPTPLQLMFNDCLKQIQQRGPDCCNTVEHVVNGKTLQIAASVLWLQGTSITNQPLNTEDAVFAYNGDVFGGDAIPYATRQKVGDTQPFFDLISSTKRINDTLCDVQGPYAFIYFNKKEQTLHFARDIFGRRSLLIAVDVPSQSLLITSVAVRTAIPFIEVPPIGIFCIHVENVNRLTLYKWPKTHQISHIEHSCTIASLFQSNITVVLSSGIVTDTEEPVTHIDRQIFDNFEMNSPTEGFETLLSNTQWKENVQLLHKKLREALSNRISTQPKFCQNCIPNHSHCNHCRVGILFSGGIDCTLLALIADEYVDASTPIDLLNVAFDKSPEYKTPDRLTGLSSLEELRRLKPHRSWHFVEINVTTSELNRLREERIADLIFPANTILDDSLGCALWFASRGSGRLEGVEYYTSPCRILLVGMGADELFGGYTRHRAALKQKGWDGLRAVLDAEWANIAHRNLGRDDRVVCDHGRQLRTPYLDEEVVRFVQNLQVWERTCPSSELPQGFGEKILLRSLAYHLGLCSAATLRKRALQFGSRIADKKENAHEISPRLLIH